MAFQSQELEEKQSRNQVQGVGFRELEPYSRRRQRERCLEQAPPLGDLPPVEGLHPETQASGTGSTPLFLFRVKRGTAPLPPAWWLVLHPASTPSATSDRSPLVATCKQRPQWAAATRSIGSAPLVSGWPAAGLPCWCSDTQAAHSHRAATHSKSSREGLRIISSPCLFLPYFSAYFQKLIQARQTTRRGAVMSLWLLPHSSSRFKFTPHMCMYCKFCQLCHTLSLCLRGYWNHKETHIQ